MTLQDLWYHMYTKKMINKSWQPGLIKLQCWVNTEFLALPHWFTKTLCSLKTNFTYWTPYNGFIITCQKNPFQTFLKGLTFQIWEQSKFSSTSIDNHKHDFIFPSPANTSWVVIQFLWTHVLAPIVNFKSFIPPRCLFSQCSLNLDEYQANIIRPYFSLEIQLWNRPFGPPTPR